MYPGESLYKWDRLNTLVICSRIPTAFASTSIEMVTKVKIEPEEVQPSTSGGGEQAEEQVKGAESKESFDSDEIDDEFLSNYCETAEIPHPMMVSKELSTLMRWWLGTTRGYLSKIKIGLIR